MKYFYGVANHYGTNSSIGFCNTWFVRAFESRKLRDAWVSDTDRIDRRKITKKDITRYIGTPKPFSGEYLAITADELADDENNLSVEIITNEYDELRVIRCLYPG